MRPSRNLAHRSARRVTLYLSLAATLGIALYLVLPFASTPAYVAAGQPGIGGPADSAASVRAGDQAVPNAMPAIPKRPVKIMPLGDSLTAGHEASVIDGYRLELLKRLPGYPIDFVGTYSSGDSQLADQNMQADGGACIRADPCNSTVMYPQTAGWIRATQPDVVLLQGGMNDFCCGREDEDPTVVQNAMRDWVQLIFATKPDVYIVVSGTPDYHEEYKNWIPQFVGEQAALGKKIYYVDYDGVSTSDTVHPDAAGYRTWADRLALVLKPILSSVASQQ
jgi:GDSL-like Lipase/Acylhydrolase family